LAATDRVTRPLAFPLCPPAIEIHGSAAAAVHAQPLSVETSTVDTPPAAGRLSCVRLNAKLHGAAACVNSTVVDATTSDPERGDGTAFAETEYETRPSPCPPADPLIEIQFAPELAVHEQSRSVATATDPLPPVALNDAVVALSVAWHLLPSGAVTEVWVLVEQLNQQSGARVRRIDADDLPMGRAAMRGMHTPRQLPSAKRRSRDIAIPRRRFERNTRTRRRTNGRPQRVTSDSCTPRLV